MICGGGVGWRLLHQHRLLRVDDQSEVLAGGGEQVHAALHLLFRGGVQGAVVGEEKFVDRGCGYARLEVHPSLIQKVTVRPAGDADPGVIITADVHQHGREHETGEEMHDGCVIEILRDFTLTPHPLEERSQMIHQLGTSVLVDLRRDRVRSGRFPAGELLHDPDGFLERWREVEIHNLCLLSQEGTAVSAEERSSALRRLDVDGFDRREEVLPFIAVRVALDLFSFASSPGVGGVRDRGRIAPSTGPCLAVDNSGSPWRRSRQRRRRQRREGCLANTHLRDDEAMVGPPVSTRDRLRHQHVPLTSPPDEDIFQQVPLTRPRMPPGGLLSLRQTEERVRQAETVFCAVAEKQQTIVV
nr:unnamed protein product [Spirometra erinaceieuropaei]